LGLAFIFDCAGAAGGNLRFRKANGSCLEM
jgi:hypothetical protein